MKSSGRPDVENEHKQNEIRVSHFGNAPEKQEEIGKLVKNFDPIFAQNYKHMQNAMKTIMASHKSDEEKLKEVKALFEPLGLDYVSKFWNMILVKYYSKSTEEATEDFESIFKPDSETAKVRKIVNFLRMKEFETAFVIVPDNFSVLIRKTEIVKNLLHEYDPTLIEIENRVLALLNENETYRDQNNKIQAYVKSCDESKIHKLQVVSDVYYKHENEDDETIKNKVKEALENL